MEGWTSYWRHSLMEAIRQASSSCVKDEKVDAKFSMTTSLEDQSSKRPSLSKWAGI